MRSLSCHAVLTGMTSFMVACEKMVLHSLARSLSSCKITGTCTQRSGQGQRIQGCNDRGCSQIPFTNQTTTKGDLLHHPPFPCNVSPQSLSLAAIGPPSIASCVRRRRAPLLLADLFAAVLRHGDHGGHLRTHQR